MYGDAMKRNLKPMLVAAAALALGAVPLAADEGSDYPKFRFGLGLSATRPTHHEIRDSTGNAAGFGVIGEWWAEKRFAVICKAEYLQYLGKDHNVGDTKVETGANAVKAGADLAFRPEGPEKGFFVFAGFGYIRVEEKVSAAGLDFSANAGSAFYSLGVGCDLSSLIGIELRYIMVPDMAFEMLGLRYVDDFSGYQIGFRFRF
jgi:hypothetical protein